jgi:hypothetical protein
MNVSKDDLNRAAAEGLISRAQADALWLSLSTRGEKDDGRARFDLAHVAYYSGAFVVIGAMGWFMTLGWESFGGASVFVLAAAYALLFALAGRTLWFKEKLRTPGGLLFTLAVWMTPLAVYGLERWLGWWVEADPGNFRGYHEWVKGGWFAMEVATIIASLVALRYVRFPFLTFPAAFSLWYMSMDLTPLLFGQAGHTWNQRLWISLFFGLAVLVAAFLIDRRTREDYAFWLYLFGLLAFWFGLTLMESHGELNKFFYFLTNFALVLLSVLLERRTFMVFGAMGVMGYLGHLSYEVFKDSMLFPFVLSLIGIAIIYFGVKYQRNRERIERAVRSLVPDAVRRLLPRARGRLT